ncbi:nucleotidyltransferase family protein [Corallococcus sp. Z5C101001]|uniref:nucleotidyltransferase family protein n=1 Tax=Corallococcus sp. Z5C101001 TaxID=2596829 RepID=UPI00117D6110|nr:nucleotidyltransferase family protein [Corallococcus sp. Z5C101001]TSC27664.1 nucleotidyltransferase family protein [Corallococcus sp. Z5C101001]
MSDAVGANRQERTLEVAEHVVGVLEQHGIHAAVIGAIALAVHYYPRQTEDFDLAININPFPRFRQLDEVLRQEGFETDLSYPDADDPLGGVLRVSGADFETIEIVNFQNPWPGAKDNTLLAQEAIQSASLPLNAGSRLRVVGLAHLIALKLFAGGWKSKADVMELLERNRPHLDVTELRDVCERNKLWPELQPLLQELGIS